MAILRERKRWVRPKPARATVLPDELTEEEGARVRTALAFLRGHLGSWTKLARAMGIKPATLEQGALRRTRRPTAGLALRAARVAGVPMEDILSGRWPVPLPVKCPTCGRS